MPTPAQSWDNFDTSAQQTPPATVQAWDQFDQAPQAAPVAATPAAPHPTMQPTGTSYEDAYNFLRTALTKSGAGLAGIPAMFDAAGDYLAKRTGVGTPSTASPFAGVAPTGQQVEDYAFNNTAPEYKPQSTAGRYGMTAATFAAPALLDPATLVPNALRLGAAGLAAQGAEDAGLPAVVGPAATFIGELALRKGLGIWAPHSSAGATDLGAKITSELPNVPPTATPAIPGLQLTTGQVTGNPQWLALDDDLGGTPAAQRNSATRLSSNQAVMRDTLGNVAPGPVGPDAAIAQTSNVNAAQTAADKAESDAWGNTGDALFSTTSLKDQVAKFQADTQATLPASARKLPSAEIGDILNLPDAAPLSTLQDIRSSLRSTANTAGQAGDGQAAALAGNTRGVGGLLESHLNNPDNLLVQTPDALKNYNAARAATAQKYASFGADGQAGAQIPDLTSGKIAPEAALTRFLPAGAEGNGTQTLSRLKLSAGTGVGLDPARSYLIGKLRDAVNGGPDAFGQVLDNYGYAFKDKDMFTPEQQSTISDARDAMAQSYRTAPAGAEPGSSTLSTLSGPTFARALYGNILGRVLPALPKFAGAAAGNAVAGAIGVPGAEEIGGQLFGGEAADEAAQGVMKGARNNIVNIVDKARQDPAFARQLQMRATAGNLKLASRVRNALPALGLSEAMALPRHQ